MESSTEILIRKILGRTKRGRLDWRRYGPDNPPSYSAEMLLRRKQVRVHIFYQLYPSRETVFSIYDRNEGARIIHQAHSSAASDCLYALIHEKDQAQRKANQDKWERMAFRAKCRERQKQQKLNDEVAKKLI